ncbi:hypothetical protein MPSEU_000134800 [Mayamaea pseudoterrestris]|nr:hypothetical protein MPSEU_000134800 [Mayamaea pseudoterrestris]
MDALHCFVTCVVALSKKVYLRAGDSTSCPTSDEISTSQQPPLTNGPRVALSRLVRTRWSVLGREQPTIQELVVKEVREDLMFERKVNVILHNPEMFRRYQRYAVASRHFSATGLCHVLLEFMNHQMKIAEILEDIRQAGQESRYPAYVVSALDEVDTETITFNGAEQEEVDVSPFTRHSSNESWLPSLSSTSPTSVLAMTNNDESVARKTKTFSLFRHFPGRGTLDNIDRSMSLDSCSTGISLPSLDGTSDQQSDDSSVESAAQTFVAQVKIA